MSIIIKNILFVIMLVLTIGFFWILSKQDDNIVIQKIEFGIPRSGPLQGMEPIENIIPIFNVSTGLVNWNLFEEPIFVPITFPLHQPITIKTDIVPNVEITKIPTYYPSFIPVVVNPTCQAQTSGCN